jgi:hypothetical protein
MAKVIFEDHEIAIWKGTNKKLINKITKSLNELAGHLGGNGIDLVSVSGEDLSHDYEFSYVPHKLWLDIGSRVRTTSDIQQRDFTDDAMKTRYPNEIGTIVAKHGSHGLCYDVYHDLFENIGCYDPDELSLI